MSLLSRVLTNSGYFGKEQTTKMDTYNQGVISTIGDAFCYDTFDDVLEYLEYDLSSLITRIKEFVDSHKKYCLAGISAIGNYECIIMNDSKYKISFKRCNKDGAVESNGSYIEGLFLTKKVYGYNETINFNGLKANSHISDVIESLDDYTFDNNGEMIFLHNVNINFNNIFHDQIDEDKLVDLVCEIILTSF